MMTHDGRAERARAPGLDRGASDRGRRPAPPRLVLLLTCCLTLATAYALLGVGAALTARPGPAWSTADTGSTVAAIAAAERFFAAVNGVLRTGDTAPLADIVAPGLVEHPGRAGDPGAAGLARALLAERTTWPGLRIVVDDLRATGPDAVTAWIHPDAPHPPAVLGFATTAAPTAWGPVEVLRIGDGRVAERWAGGSDAVLLEPLGQLPPIDAGAHGMVMVTVYAVQAGVAGAPLGTGPGPRLVAVRSGAVSVAHDRSPDATPTPLQSGGVLAIAAGTDATVTNTGVGPALILVALAARPPSEPDMAFAAPANTSKSGVAAVAWTSLPVPPGGRPTLERVLLEPGALVTRGAAAGETLILVERGTSRMAPADRRGLWVIAGDGGWQRRAPAEALVPGDLVQLGAGQAGTWRAGAGEPVALLVLSTGLATGDPARPGPEEATPRP